MITINIWVASVVEVAAHFLCRMKPFLQVIVHGLRESNIFSDLLLNSSSLTTPLISDTNMKESANEEAATFHRLLSSGEERELEMSIPPLAASSLDELMDYVITQMTLLNSTYNLSTKVDLILIYFCIWA